MGAINEIVKFYQEGGEFMHPILLVMAIGVAIAIERVLYLSLARAHNRRTWNQLLPLLQQGKFHDARQLAEQTNAAIGKVLSYGLARMNAGREQMELAMEEGLMEVTPRLEKRTHYLATLANIATLLGLLGTIIGLISAFSSISLANPNEKAQLLSSSISVAMNTTAFGLMVGIPLLLVHAFLQSKTNQLIDSLEMAVVKVLNNVADRPRSAV
jgi:Biopolymer transport proteins